MQCELRQLQAYMPGKAFIAECQRQSDALDDALLNALCLPEGEAKGIEQMPLSRRKRSWPVNLKKAIRVF